MIAEAIKQQNPHYTRILVDLQTIRWTNTKNGKRYVCLTPEEAAAKLVDFDQGRAIEPFTFGMRVAQVTAAKGDGRGRKRLNGQMTIEGGEPLRAGHLRGTEGSGSAVNAAKRVNREAAAAVLDPPAEASNVVRSSRKYRSYGRRLLKG
jgi:hypothetical protein